MRLQWTLLLTCAGEYLCSPGCERTSRSCCVGSVSKKEAPNWGNRPLRADSSGGAMLLAFML